MTTGSGFVRWPNSRISPNRSERNSCSRVPRLSSDGCLVRPSASVTVIVCSTEGSVDPPVPSLGDLCEELLSMANDARLTLALKLHARLFEKTLGKCESGPVSRVAT